MWLCGEEIYELCVLNLPKISKKWLFCFIGSALTLIGISLHLTVLSHDRTKHGTEKKYKIAKEEEYISNRIDTALNRRSRM